MKSEIKTYSTIGCALPFLLKPLATVLMPEMVNRL
jgi:hypothetical protein